MRKSEKLEKAIRDESYKNPYRAQWEGIFNSRKWRSMARAAGISDANLDRALHIAKYALREAHGKRPLAIEWLNDYSKRTTGKTSVLAKIASNFLKYIGTTLKNPHIGTWIQPFNVYLNGKLIERVYLTVNSTIEEVKRSLVGHGGFPSNIVVRRGRAYKSAR